MSLTPTLTYSPIHAGESKKPNRVLHRINCKEMSYIRDLRSNQALIPH